MYPSSVTLTGIIQYSTINLENESGNGSNGAHQTKRPILLGAPYTPCTHGTSYTRMPAGARPSRYWLLSFPCICKHAQSTTRNSLHSTVYVVYYEPASSTSSRELICASAS